MTSYLPSIDTPSLSRTVFEIFDLRSFQGSTLTFDLWRSSEVETVYTIRKPIYDFLFDFHGHHLSISYRFRNIRLRSFWGLTLTFDLWRSSRVKNLYTIRKPIYDFLSNFHRHFLSIQYRFRNIRLHNFLGFDLDLWPLKVIWGQNFFIPFESPYMTSYLTSMDTIFLSRTVFEIFDFNVFGVWPWPLTSEGHLGSKFFYTIRKPVYDVLSNFHRHSLFISFRFRENSGQNFLGSNKMADFDLFKVKVIDWYF